MKKFIKWHNEVIGTANKDNTVEFSKPKFNKVVEMYTKGKVEWSSAEFRDFISDRVISKNRKDIEKYLFKCGLATYDEFELAKSTHLINPKDLLWFTSDINESYEKVIEGVFKNIFVNKQDADGFSFLSPDGINIKRYGIYNGEYGIYKEKLYPASTDIESENAVYELSKLLGVKCCTASIVGNNKEVFSKFEYKYFTEYMVHAKYLFNKNELSENYHKSLFEKLPLFSEDIARMLIVDFVTRQTDRNLSNIGILIKGQITALYSLYDNGRALFFEDTEEFMEKAIENIELYSSEFGLVGTYLDHLIEISKTHDIKKLVNLNISKDKLVEIYKSSGIYGNKLEACVEWTYRTMKLLKNM